MEVILILDDGTQLACHRQLLSNSSPYFHAMFTRGFAESDKKEVQLHGITKDSMLTLISYAKSPDAATLNLSQTNVFNILQASGMLQFESVRQLCCDFLKNIMRISNVLQILGK